MYEESTHMKLLPPIFHLVLLLLADKLRICNT